MNPDQGLMHLAEFDADYADLLPADRTASILDVGCGMGHFLRYLQARGYGGARGVDASADQVAYCRANGLPNVELVDDLFGYLGARVGAFDLVTLNDVLEHFTKNEIIELLVVTKAALRTGGRIVVRTPNIACVYGPFGRYIDFTHEVGFSETSLRQVLLAVGFEDVVIRGNRVPVTWRPKRLAWLLARRVWAKVLGLIYLIEAGTDRPRIYAKVLVGSAKNAG
jgi:2-polyprenyl-3-methyl-5-hydroxy-6-metoxy-1,4-benzoquinol methylase